MRLLTLLFFSISAFGQGVVGAGIGRGERLPQPQAPKPEAPAYKPEELCTVEGVVRNSVTGEPLSKARITLVSISPRGPGSPLTTSTNLEGKFAMKAIEPGQYRLLVDRAGFVRAEFGAKPGVMAGGTTLTLDKGQSMSTIEFRLSPHSVITGRVFDEDGDPVLQAQVQLLTNRFFQGRRQLLPMNSASTNDLGEYRLFGIPPGKYYLSVTYRNMGMNPAVDRSANPQPDEGYAPTYYPGTPDIASAAQITVALGRTIQGIDATLRKTRTFRVKGAVAGFSGSRNRGGMVSIRSSDPASVAYSFERNSTIWRGPKSEFELRGVRPGSYIVEAIYSEPPDQMLSARTRVEVTDRDVEGLAMTLGSWHEVKGNVRLDGQGSLNFAGMRVNLQSQPSGATMGVSMATVNDDGSFTIARVTPDAFHVRVSGAPPEFYLKSVRLADTDVLENGLDLEKTGSVSGLDVVMSPGAASVSGSVTDEKGNAVKSAALLLRPTDAKPSMLSLLVKHSTTDQNGQFKLTGITPGAYSLIAFEGIDMAEIQDPDLFQQHESKAIKLDLKQSVADTRTLKAISLEQKSQ
jgi:hypothetical protein